MDVRRTMRSMLLRILGAEATSGHRNPARWLVDWIHGGNETDSGITINAQKVLHYAPVWYGVNKIAGHIGQMPLVLHEQTDERRRRRAVEHPSYRLLKKRPNRHMGAAVFKETLQAHALIEGNGRAAIDRNLRGDAVELIPLLPDRTKTIVVNGEKWHFTTITHEDGRTEDRKLRDQDVLHIAGLGYDGLVGYPLWEFAKNSLGLGLASEKSANRHFRNDGTPGLLLEAPKGMFRDEAEATDFLANFRAAHEGLDKRSKVGLLREGITARALESSAGSDGQWIEQRTFQRQEAALWLLLEQILGDDSSVSYKSLEQKMLAYLVNCLNRWIVKWEEECDEKLLREREKQLDTHYFKFVTGALLRSDTATTMSTAATAIKSRILNPNEARAWFELDPYDGGDEFFNPAITPGGPDEDDAAAEDEDDDEEGVDDQARVLIVARLEDLIAVECKRIRAAAAKSKNFVEWIDGFYSEDRFLATVARVVRSSGGEDWHAIEHVNASKQQILDVAGRSTASDLVATIEQTLATWPARAEQLADEILSLEAVA